MTVATLEASDVGAPDWWAKYKEHWRRNPLHLEAVPSYLSGSASLDPQLEEGDQAEQLVDRRLELVWTDRTVEKPSWWCSAA